MKLPLDIVVTLQPFLTGLLALTCSLFYYITQTCTVSRVVVARELALPKPTLEHLLYLGNSISDK
jgi:hypothetical protein